MKIVYKNSIRDQVNAHINGSTANPIKYIALTESEYIQFLEEITPQERLILTLPDRQYKGVNLRITY